MAPTNTGVNVITTGDVAWIACADRRLLTEDERARLGILRRAAVDPHVIARIDALLNEETP